MAIRDEIVIGVTDCGRKYDNYTSWLEVSGRPIRIVKLSASLSNGADTDRCDGIMLTGGGDIHPRFFGKPEALGELDPDQIDESRDEFELGIVERVVQRGNVPLLGICRGLQIVNVYYNGDLLLDLEKIGKMGHGAIVRSWKEGQEHVVQVATYDREHPVIVHPASLLHDIVGSIRGTVTSSHHQAVGRMGRGLQSSAWSEDGVVEAMEYENKKRGFLMLVQWHPERMKSDSSFSGGVRDGFLRAAGDYSRNR